MWWPAVVKAEWAGPTTTNSTAITKLRGKPEATTAVVELLMMGMRMTETC
jgi:hypothetical protein